ncbi:MAG: energy-coupled thiamine transporter ThiT [Erysipelotrichaceae bacterium]
MKIRVKDLSFMALYLALFVVLDYVAHILPKMPQGGSLGLGVLALLLASYHLGWKKGAIVALGSVVLQFIMGQMYVVHPIQFLLDYGIAFGVYGIASLMPIWVGITLTNVVRYLCSVISGIVFFGEYADGNVVVYSLSYNAWYMVPTLIICLVFVPILCKALLPKLQD